MTVTAMCCCGDKLVLFRAVFEVCEQLELCGQRREKVLLQVVKLCLPLEKAYPAFSVVNKTSLPISVGISVREFISSSKTSK